MSMIKIILSIIFVIVCVAMTVIVLLQEGKSSGGLGAVAGAGGDTYWSKNKGRSAEGNLDKITKYLAIAFVLIALVLNLRILP